MFSPYFLLLLIWLVSLMTIVVWVFIGMFTQHRDRPNWRWASDRRAWLILWVLGLGISFGTIGALIPMSQTEEQAVVPDQPSRLSHAGDIADETGQGWLGHWVDAVYKSSQEFTLDGDVAANDSVFTRMARLAGMAAIILLGYEAIQLLFAKPLQQLWLNRHKEHIVICGLGSIGRSIINDLTDSQSPAGGISYSNVHETNRVAKQYRIVVVERDKDHPDIAWAESRESLSS
jgi:hypothetical protein